jgi:tetratricopeptide (TPR) repeat protein
MNEFIALGLESGLENEEMAAGRLNVRYYLRQQPVMLAIVLVLVVIGFLAVTALSHLHYAQRQALGDRWFNRGIADLNAKNYAAAVTEFRAALLYSRDNFDYQLNLAEALIGSKHTGEASAYLLNLWDRQPENGVVNLELARIAAQQAQTQDAVRHYLDAVYAAWPADQESKRYDARLELIELLLRINRKAQAQAELIALSENVGDVPAAQKRIADLFLRADDPGRALATYQAVLREQSHDSAALAGAGQAAFKLGSYPLAQRYLQSALAANANVNVNVTVNDQQSADLLNVTDLVLNSDPFRPGLSTAERDRLVVEAFSTAGDRLKTCALPDTSVAGPAHLQPGLNDEWTSLRPRVTAAGLRRDISLAESAMDLVFRIVRQTSKLCGTPTGKDLALLLISKLHEGSN